MKEIKLKKFEEKDLKKNKRVVYSYNRMEIMGCTMGRS